MSLGIGSTIWIFDGNRRRYREGERGGPIYREHFIPLEIVGETSRSWLCGVSGYCKVNKKTLCVSPSGFGVKSVAFPSERAVDDDCWVHDERFRVVREVQALSDADTLRAIDALLKSRRSL